MAIPTEIIAAAWNAKVSDKPYDNLFTDNPLLKTLREAGFEKQTSGAQIEASVEFFENPNAGFIPKGGQIPTAVSDTFTSALYDFKTFATTVQILWEDELATSGDSAKFDDYVGKKLENGEKTALKAMNRSFYAVNEAPDAFDALPKLASSNSQGFVVGGLNPQTYPQWRNVSVSGANTATAFDNLRNAMRQGYTLISRGSASKAPKYFITYTGTVDGYESILVANERFVKDGSKARGANGGFDPDELKYRAATLRGDEDCPTTDGWFLHPDAIKLVYAAWMKAMPVVEPSNQLAKSLRIATRGNLIVTTRRQLGRIYNIA